MGADSKIAWTDHTFNPWWGCVRVSPGCQHCYAETFAKRTGNAVWGVGAPRRFFGQKHWDEPLKWAEKAGASAHKPRVFCASMADVCEDRRDLDAERERLWTLIQATAPALDWLLLTKRPENLRRLVPADILRRCWVGTTAEDQQRADERIPHLLATPAAVRFVSAEPLLSHVTLRHEWISPSGYMGNSVGIDWTIVGGESGPKARLSDLAHHRSLIQQCRAAGVAVFEKQAGANVIDSDYGLHPIRFRDRAGADPAEWPEDLRVREWPR